MPKFKVGDKLKHIDYVNERTVVEVNDNSYTLLITTPGIYSQGTHDTVWNKFDYVDMFYTVSMSDIERYVNDKLQKFLSGI